MGRVVVLPVGIGQKSEF